MLGNNPPELCLNLLREMLADNNILSVNIFAFDKTIPKPIPGKTSALLHCAITWVIPLYKAGSKGDPVAINARPSLQVIKSCGQASLNVVGLDKRKNYRHRVLVRHNFYHILCKSPRLGGAPNQSCRFYNRDNFKPIFHLFLVIN